MCLDLPYHHHHHTSQPPSASRSPFSFPRLKFTTIYGRSAVCWPRITWTPYGPFLGEGVLYSDARYGSLSACEQGYVNRVTCSLRVSVWAMLMAHHYIIAVQPQCVHTETQTLHISRRRRRRLVIFLLSYSLFLLSPFSCVASPTTKGPFIQ